MTNCIICDTKLGFTNKPTFGQGKLSDGNEICFKCFSKMTKSNGNKIPKFSTMKINDVKEFMSNSEKTVNESNSRLDEIKEQIKNLKLDNVSSFFGRKEVNELPNILFAEESVLDIVQGTYNNKMGILVATENRLIFIDKGFMYGLKVEDFPYDKITSIVYETGFVQGKIIIMASGNKAEIDNVIKNRVKPFSDLTRTQISNSGKSNNIPVQNVTINQQVDVADQLMKLASLKENGILTNEEFQTQKAKLLSQ